MEKSRYKELKRENVIKLNLGCYDNIEDGYINHDREKYLPEIDVAHDLETFPYPWKDNTFSEIKCKSVIEHISAHNTVKVFEELYRISKHNAIIKIKVPFGLNWIKSIDHHRGFDYFTFMVLTSNREWLGNFNYELISMKSDPTFIGKIIPTEKLKRCFAYFFKGIVRNIYVELKVIK